MVQIQAIYGAYSRPAPLSPLPSRVCRQRNGVQYRECVDTGPTSCQASSGTGCFPFRIVTLFTNQCLPRAGCARATRITSVTTPNRSARVWREGPLHNQVRKDGECGDGGRHAWQSVNGRRLPGVLQSRSRDIHHPRNQDSRVFGFNDGGGINTADEGRSLAS